MRTSELAGRAGLSTETLRYYERRGLLAEPIRTQGGYRDDPDGAVALLEERIRDLRRMHASLTQLVATCDLPRADRSCALLEAIDDSHQSAAR